MKIYLIGLPAVGKTYIGQLLAKKINLQFIDLDYIIEKKYKLTIDEIFKNFGENAFRQIEAEELSLLINNNNSFVLATGGGTPCFYNNINKLASSGLTIWVKAAIDTILEHIKCDDNQQKRPLLYSKDKRNIKHKLIELEKQRSINYVMAHITYNINKHNIEDLIRYINNWKKIVKSL